MPSVRVRLALGGLLILGFTGVLLASLSARAASPVAAQEACTFFPESGHTLCGRFRSYWEHFGGLPVFGYPLTDEFVDPQTGRLTQWFERARFEWHPGAFPERYDVLLGLLGREVTIGREQELPFRPAQPLAGCTYFPETQHNLCGGFRAYWETFGGLAVYGYPLSEEFVEVNPDTRQTYVVHYFERQRFEWHPGEWPERFDVMLGRLGAQLLERATVPTPLCPVDDVSFCRFVEAIDTALECGDTERYMIYVAFEPYVCKGTEGPFVPTYDGRPGRVLLCTRTGILNAGAACLQRDEYAVWVAPYLRDVYAIVYPPAPELAECFGWGDPLVIVRGNLDPPDATLVVRCTDDGWRVVQTIGWRPSIGLRCIGMPTHLFTHWPY
ncbi:MAG: hypothetical protein RMK01_12575 [Thermomicrobium sp.]|nr:hypothetical protein [Thermomicrobium sp.]